MALAHTDALLVGPGATSATLTCQPPSPEWPRRPVTLRLKLFDGDSLEFGSLTKAGPVAGGHLGRAGSDRAGVAHSRRGPGQGMSSREARWVVGLRESLLPRVHTPSGVCSLPARRLRAAGQRSEAALKPTPPGGQSVTASRVRLEVNSAVKEGSSSVKAKVEVKEHIHRVRV